MDQVRIGWRSAAMATVLWAGCSLPVQGTFPVEDGGGMVSDAHVEPHDVGPVDVGPPHDTGAPDAGTDAPNAACTARCDGETAVTCRSTGEVRTDCAAMRAFCTPMPPACTPWVCTPDTTRCSASGAAQLTCDGRGASESPIDCVSGCDLSTGMCRSSIVCSRDIEGTVFTGTMTIDLCGMHDDARHDRDQDCSPGDSDGDDVIFRLAIDRRRDVRIELRSIDPANPVDSIVYLRTACSTASTQFACDDDIADGDYDSLLNVTLDAGEYFLVVDSLDHDMWACGAVELTVSYP